MCRRATDVLQFVAWMEDLLWRSTLDLDYVHFSFDEIAAVIGVEAPLLAPGDRLPDEMGTAQLYWPKAGP